MNTKSLVWLGFAVGSTVGSFIPLLWGGSEFSISSILLGALFGIVGIYAGFKISRY